MALKEKDLTANVYVGMRYWYPFTEEAVQQVDVCLFCWLCDFFSSGLLHAFMTISEKNLTFSCL